MTEVSISSCGKRMRPVNYGDGTTDHIEKNETGHVIL